MQPKQRISTQEFCKQSGQSSVTLWRKSKTDNDFPTPVYILNKKLWYQDQVTAWIEANEKTEPPHNNLVTKAKASV